MRTFCPKEYKVVALRECPLPDAMPVCDTPDRAAEYWRAHVVNHSAFNPDVESFVVLLLNTRRRVKGHVLVSTGTLDTLLVHPREVFRPAIVAAAGAVLVMHNLCGAPHKSCYVTRRFMCSHASGVLKFQCFPGGKECHA